MTTYRPKELSRFLGIPHRTILAAIRSGDLECCRVNKRLFVIRSEAAANWSVKHSNRTQLGLIRHKSFPVDIEPRPGFP